MTRTVSEASLVSTSSPIQLENSQIIVRDEDENSNVLSIDEYCPNREAVNLENAAVNIDNSNDVIIGPVTQLNVNGNVTIYSGNEAVTATSLEQEQSRINIANGAKPGKCEKSDSEEQDLNDLSKNKNVIRILVSISVALLLSIGVVVLILHYTHNALNDNQNNYVTTIPGDRDDNHLGSHQVLDRSDWGGRLPRSYENITSPVRTVIIKHTGGGNCSTYKVCAGKVQSIQSASVSEGLPDIRYSFLVGGDGNIYVGRGWDVQPAQINDTIDIAFIGSYSFDVLTDSMAEATQLLLKDGVEKNKLTENYKLIPHNQTMNTESPGSNVYEKIIHWPHFDGQLKFGRTLVKRGEKA